MSRFASGSKGQAPDYIVTGGVTYRVVSGPGSLWDLDGIAQILRAAPLPPPAREPVEKLMSLLKAH